MAEHLPTFTFIAPREPSYRSQQRSQHAPPSLTPPPPPRPPPRAGQPAAKTGACNLLEQDNLYRIAVYYQEDRRDARAFLPQYPLHRADDCVLEPLAAQPPRPLLPSFQPVDIARAFQLQQGGAVLAAGLKGEPLNEAARGFGAGAQAQALPQAHPASSAGPAAGRGLKIKIGRKRSRQEQSVLTGMSS
jgi:hypothetical protein